MSDAGRKNNCGYVGNNTELSAEFKENGGFKR
jgi:hypothetical protein